LVKKKFKKGQVEVVDEEGNLLIRNADVQDVFDLLLEVKEIVEAIKSKVGA